MPATAPYGSWKSPITADLVASGDLQFSDVQVNGGLITWLERRPHEAARQVIVRRAPDGHNEDITPPGYNARTLVHEYGSGDYWVHGQTVFFVNYADQRLYRQQIGGKPQPITPEPEISRGLRYTDGRVTLDGRWTICVREQHHPDREADTTLVAIPADGSAAPHIVAEGHNFYSNPRISPDGKRLLFLCWDHPNMPWDGCELWLADLAPDCSLTNSRRVAGGPDESIFQPEWGPDGAIYFCSDRSGWWNLYHYQDGKAVNLAPVEAEIGNPLWRFAYRRYAFLSGGRVACMATFEGVDQFCLIHDGKIEKLPLPYTFAYLPALNSDGDDTIIFAASAPALPSAVGAFRVSTGELTLYREHIALPFDRAYLSEPTQISFPTTGGEIAHAHYYPPTNPDFEAPPGDKPPLIVFSHGGPTSRARLDLRLGYQFWASRGFALLDVNYRGSTGYGRAYWKKLYGRWGVMDVEDCIAAARYAVEHGLADPKRTAISGESAGGYCTLCALTFHSDFQAGSSWYGIGDMQTMVGDTHKFESRYCDMLVANTYPAPKEILRERSPIHFTTNLSAPMALLQGAEDKVVPPNQAEDMARALDAKGLPYMHLVFEGEQHGFHKAESIIRAYESELYFYSHIFGFEPADHIAPVEIKNL